MVNLNVVLVSAAVGAFIGCLEAAPQGKNQNNEAIQAKVATKFVNYYKPRQQEMGDGMHNFKPMQWVTGYPAWKPTTTGAQQAPQPTTLASQKLSTAQVNPATTKPIPATSKPAASAQPTRSTLQNTQAQSPSIQTTQQSTISKAPGLVPTPSSTKPVFTAPSATSTIRSTLTPSTTTSKVSTATTQPTQPSNQPAKPQAAGVSGINCELFSKAVAAGGYSQPSNAQCKSFIAGLPVGNIASMTEAAMFLTQIMWESDGLKAKEEYYCKTNDCKSAYGSAKDLPGKVYSGRGYIQLTWADNYDAASRALYGDDRLLQNPEQVSSNEQTAWDVSFWYWKDRVRTNPQVLSGSFGTSTNMINGALECRGGYADKAKKRFEIYKKVLAVMDPSATAIESGCYN